MSSDEQALYGDSLRAQIEELRKWAKNNNFEILDEYIDDGYTARDLKRPELRRMLNDVKQYDFILFTKIDRWSRGVRAHLNVGKATIQKYECNQIQNLKTTHIRKLCALFDKTPNYFIFDEIPQTTTKRYCS